MNDEGLGPLSLLSAVWASSLIPNPSSFITSARTFPRKTCISCSPFFATSTPNSVPRSVNFMPGVRTSKPGASGFSTVTLNLPRCRYAPIVERISNFAGPSKTVAAPP